MEGVFVCLSQRAKGYRVLCYREAFYGTREANTRDVEETKRDKGGRHLTETE